jgi:tetratricopeptide (TPR) repeat protein
MTVRAFSVLLVWGVLLMRTEALTVQNAQVPSDRMEQANRWIAEGKFEQAQKELEAILLSESSPPPLVHYYLAYTLYNRNQLARAESSLEQFLQRSPASPPGRLLKAHLLFRRGKYQESAVLAEEYLSQQPSSANAYKLLGLDWFMLGRSEPAENAFGRASELAPEDVEAFYYLGRIRFERKNLVGALDAFQKTIKLDPTHVKALNQLGQTYEWMANYDLARELYLKSIENEKRQSTRSEWPYFNLGSLYLKLAKPGEAAVYLRQALDRNPGWGEGKAKLAQALLALDQREEALGLLKDAVTLDPQNREARYRLAQLLMKSGQREEALRQFDLLEKSKQP